MLNNLPALPELLAPAGDWDALKAALAGGADAVYMGGTSFSARQYASNFDLPKLQEAIDLLHLHGKKIYITVNTLIADSELKEALLYLEQLYNFGVDAIIIQDLGLIKQARLYLPDLELHASTQMTVHNSEGAQFLGQMGIKRVVLARELTKEEVAAIVTSSGVEVEVFVHGALCVCYSGQCLMSSIIGGRSGNRGRCAQPCRMEYQLIQDNDALPAPGAHLLSPKDLALIPVLPELHRAGVRSLKIEGRMKKPEYVYTVVKIYRQALDRYAKAPEEYAVQPEELRELEQSFNRGFSTGYFGGNRNAEIMSFKRPNNRGVFLGRVSTSNRQAGMITLKLEAPLEAGDEIEVWVSQGGRTVTAITVMEKQGQTVTSAPAGTLVSIPIQGKVFPGDRIFKVFSIKMQTETKQMLEASTKIPCQGEVSGAAGSVLRLVFRDNNGNQADAVSTIALQPAKNRPLTKEVLEEQLGRLGNTPFQLESLVLKLEPNLMLPVSELNELRRNAISALTLQRLSRYQRNPVNLTQRSLNDSLQSASPFPSPKETLISVWAGDLESVKAAAAEGANLIYAGGDELKGFRWTQDLLAQAVLEAHQAGARLVVGLPRINREGQRQRWVSDLKTAISVSPDGVIVSELGSLELVLAQSDLAVFINYPFNIFNLSAINSFDWQRVGQIALSPELTLTQVNQLAQAVKGRIRLEALVQGPLELMVSEYCPVNSVIKATSECGNACRKHQYYLRDRLNLDFPIFTDQFCRMHLLNSMDHCLYGDLEKLAKIPGMVLRLELKTFSAAAVRKYLQAYRFGLKKVLAGELLTDSEQVINEFKAISNRGITKGHYFRGVE